MTSSNAGQIAAKLLDAIVDDPTHGLCLRMSLTPEDVKEAASILHQQEERIEALMRERTSLIDTKREQIDRLTAERDAALAEIERMTPQFVAYEYLESPAGREIAEARVKVLEEALESARTHHEEQDKALSKQPPSSGPNGNQWARMLHREQIDAISTALQQTKEKGNG